jgi:HEAT repeat protein
MGAAAQPAIQELTRVLRQDESEPVRNGAVYALGQIASPDDKGVVDALIEAATKDTDANLRGNAREILVRFNPEAAAQAGVTNAAWGVLTTVAAGSGR